MSKTGSESDKTFLEFNIRFEKVKETKIYREYLNLAEVLANVGGVLKVLTMVFFMICFIVSTK